jgi:hypothetical protein
MSHEGRDEENFGGKTSWKRHLEDHDIEDGRKQLPLFLIIDENTRVLLPVSVYI